MATQTEDRSEHSITQKNEIQLFIFLTAILIPVIAVTGIAAYGFCVWIYQMFAGAPGV